MRTLQGLPYAEWVRRFMRQQWHAAFAVLGWAGAALFLWPLEMYLVAAISVVNMALAVSLLAITRSGLKSSEELVRMEEAESE